MDSESSVKEFSGAVKIENYVKKKAVAQGMLDLALLLANASQLEFIIKTGEYHPYYTFLLWLVSLSICIQVFQAVICIILGLIFNIKEMDRQKTLNIINNVSSAISVVVVALNIVISVFDIKSFYSVKALRTNAELECE